MLDLYAWLARSIEFTENGRDCAEKGLDERKSVEMASETRWL